MELFRKKEARIYFDEKKAELASEIVSMSDNDIMTADFEAWIEYYVSKYQIEPIVLYETNITLNINETKVKRYNQWSSMDRNESKYYMIDGYSISYKIPYDGSPVLLELQPDSFIMTKFEVDSMINPRGEEVGYFNLSFDYTKQELNDQQDVEEFTKKKFQHELTAYKTMVGNVNANANQYKASLPNYIKEQLAKRRDKASDFKRISEKLNIPLSLNQDAPNVAPIVLKRIVRTPVNMPQKSKTEPEYCIADKDYDNIINIIHSVCQSMEATARTFTKNGEEELRDFIVATLNTHYDGRVTGETFRKIGKTDIHILFDNKAAYIGECKIWHGIKNFEEAISQLFGYSTWKDTKMSLIVFNKENKDFQSIRKHVEGWVSKNAVSYTKHNISSWQCKIRKPEQNEWVNVNIAVYDLAIDINKRLL